jgi:putative endonuclease
MHGDMESAIVREKRIKDWKRAWKVRLIEAENPEWRDLAVGFGFEPVGGEEGGY